MGITEGLDFFSVKDYKLQRPLARPHILISNEQRDGHVYGIISLSQA